MDFGKNIRQFMLYCLQFNSCYDAMNEKLFCGLIMVDLKKACDANFHKKLLKKLDHYGIRGIVNELISNYLSNRKQFVYLLE